MSRESLTGLTQNHLTEYQIGTQSVLAHPLAGEALEKLYHQAERAGFELGIASGFRDYRRQKAIWDAKYSGQRVILDNQSQPIDPASLSDEEKVLAILRWSALPGASRHHWGTDFDVYAKNCLPEGVSLQLEPWEYQTDHQKAFSDWLSQEMQSFGFYLPYQNDLGGVAIEPWHISFEAVAKPNLNALNVETIRETLHISPIEGLQIVLPMLDTIYNRFINNVGD
jgi:LAS superfamily LD-carboxypeptidase LdcB